MMKVRTRVIALGASALTTGAVATAALTPTAAASGAPIVTVVKAQESKVTPKLSILEHISLSRQSDASKYVPELTALAKDFDGAATAVAGASTTTATQKRAQTEWVSAGRGTAKGLDELAGAFRDLAAGNPSAAETVLKRAQAKYERSIALGQKADALLGINR